MYRIISLFTIFLLVAGNVYAAEEIVFSRLTSGYWQLWSMASDGGNIRQLTSSKVDKRDPLCIENGTKILFRTNRGTLVSMDQATLEETELLTQYARINNPHYCDNTKQALFVRFDPREIDISDIWISDLDGKESRILTKDKKLKYQPVFNRSCDSIAFVQADDKKGRHHIWIMDKAGSNARQITFGKGINVLPTFLPDGGGLIFTSNREGSDYELYQIDINGEDVIQLTDNQSLDTSPSVSPESGRLVFVSTRGGNQQIWLLNEEGAKAIQLTDGEAEAVDPQWCVQSKHNKFDKTN